MSDSLFSLAGKVAVVTGASRGIGEAIARAMAKAGAHLMLAARKPDALALVVGSIHADGGVVRARPCHTGKPGDIDLLFAEAIAAYGKVDILVNNAATNVHFGPMVTAERGQWEKNLEVNLEGYFETSRRLALHLGERGAPGAIINIASVAGLGGSPLQGVYAATKAAVISMTQTMAVELGPSGVRVNAIAPGLIRTKFSSALVENEDIAGRIISRTPLGRVGEPGEIAGAAVYLASDAASYVTGHTLVVDGGLMVSAL